MQAAWRLAISSLSARRSRTALLSAAVTLSAALIATVACAISSGNGAIETQLEGQIGSAELRIASTGRAGVFAEEIAEIPESWPEVDQVLPLIREPLSLRVFPELMLPAPEDADGNSPGGFTRQRTEFTATGYGNGVVLNREFESRPREIVAGRLPTKPGEILIDTNLAERLGWLYRSRGPRGGGLSNPGHEIDYLDVAAPTLPDAIEPGEDAAALAAELNTMVGIRPGDTVEVIRFLNLPTSPEKIEQFSRDTLVPYLGPLFEIRVEMIEAVLRFLRPRTTLTVSGIARGSPLGGQPQAWADIESLGVITGVDGVVERLDIELRQGVDAVAVEEKYKDTLPDGLILQTTEKVTSSLDKNLASNQLGFILATVLAFMSAAFIIMTGLTTGLAEQQRGLAVLRCIGATKTQMVLSQLYTGLIVGLSGAILGTPLGVFFAWGIVKLASERLPTGLQIPWTMLFICAAGAVISGLIGAVFPAYRVAGMSPLRALSNRAEGTRPAAIWKTLGFAIFCLCVQAAIVGGAPTGDFLFWGYSTTGLPAMFIGYFLLAVPGMVLVTKLLGEPISRLLVLPPRLLSRTVEATPFRHGFTAGAMMAGLALMIAIWTNGGSVMRDWLGKIQFPDAFINGLRLPVAAQERLNDMEFVQSTCAITMHPVQVDAFGVSQLQNYATTFVAFEPQEFFAMTSIDFIEGEREPAIAALEAGGAVIVGREFQESKGLGVGDRFLCTDRGVEHEFEIVGVVTSPGLELVSKFFNIGEEYIDQSIHAVFGSRDDMRTRFGSDNIQLVQIQFDWERLPGVAPERPRGASIGEESWYANWAVAEIQDRLAGYGVIEAGSGVTIREQITLFVGGSLYVFTGVAVIAMLKACFGVANLIVASIEARRFEFGVLRALGGQPTMLVRLVIGEAILIGITAALLGTLMGFQGSWAGVRVYQLLLGLGIGMDPAWGPIAFGWGVVLVFTIGAAAPAVLRLNQAKTRELLASVRG